MEVPAKPIGFCGHGGGIPPDLSIVCFRVLESKLPGYLYLSRVVGNAVIDATEDGRVNHRGWIIKRWVIQHVFCIEPQIEVHPLGYLEGLGQRGIPLGVNRRYEKVSSGISD